MTTWSSPTRNSSTYSQQAKNTTTFTEYGRVLPFLLIGDGYFLLIESPYRLIIEPAIGHTTYSMQVKN